MMRECCFYCFFFQAEDGIRDWSVTGVQTCALPILYAGLPLMPMTPAPEDVLTIAPPPCLRISGISCFMHRKTLRRLVSRIRFHSTSSAVLLVGDVLHPVGGLPVELFLDGDVGHGRGRGR